jgi:hypothetical protein
MHMYAQSMLLPPTHPPHPLPPPSPSKAALLAPCHGSCCLHTTPCTQLLPGLHAGRQDICRCAWIYDGMCCWMFALTLQVKDASCMDYDKRTPL